MTFLDQRGGEILKRLPPSARGAEVGVWDGRLSQWLLHRHPALELFMVDRWSAVPHDHRYIKSGSQMARADQSTYDKLYKTCIKIKDTYAPRAHLLKCESIDAAKLFRDATLDFVFIDADHSYEGVREDIVAWRPKVMKSGWLCGHDWNHPEHQGEWGVTQAVEEFAEEESRDIELGDNRTWFVRV